MLEIQQNWKGNYPLGNVFSIAFFNFAGISVTKEMSATTRMVLDSSRTIVIWLCSILFGWQTFEALQLLGFAFLLTGMFIYNNIVFAPLIKRFRSRRGNTELRVSVNESLDNERAPLLRPPSIANDSTTNAWNNFLTEIYLFHRIKYLSFLCW